MSDKLNILLVADRCHPIASAPILQSLKQHLLRADSAGAALDVLLATEIAVILVELISPEMDWFEFARLVRSHSQLVDIPIIFVTAMRPDDPVLIPGYQLGATDFVSTPLIPEILEAKLLFYLDLHRQRQKWWEVNRELEVRVTDRTQDYESALRVAESHAAQLEQEVWERHTAEESLMQKVEEFQTLLDTLPIGVFVAHDTECAHVTGNRIGYDLFRISPDTQFSDPNNASGRLDHFLIRQRGKVISWSNMPLPRAANGETVEFEEIDIELANGEVNHALISARPLFDANGLPRGAVATVLDITQRKRYEQTLLEADRRKDEFLATLAHELRNPLAPLANALEIWTKHSLPPQEEGELRDIMTRQVHQLRRLVDDLLDISRITHNKIELQRNTVRVDTIVESALETSRPLISAAGHHVSLNFGTAPIWVSGDCIRLTQVFANLLNNAAKYTPPGGVITIESRLGEGHVDLCFRDNGIGIRPEELGRIFELFARGNNSLTRECGGLGVGLTLVKRLVELHGGSCRAESAGLGQGSEFIVQLPTSPAPEMSHEKEASPAEGLQGTPPRHRVLVVDDLRASGFLVSRMLESLGQEVVTVTSGADAISAFDAKPFDLIISDISMPGMDGYELARQIRARNTAVRLVALTGFGQAHDQLQAQRAGFDRHLTKPVNMGGLRQLLAGLASPSDCQDSTYNVARS